MFSFLKKNYLWILLFGSLTGINEMLIGTIDMPYRSVVINSITLVILSIARTYFPKKGTSLLIIIIALLFKINSVGVTNCSTSMILCGPTAMLLLGIFFEVFASVFTKFKSFTYKNCITVNVLTAMTAFIIFAFMNTYILKTWDTSRMLEYIFIKGILTAIASCILSLTGIFFVKTFKSEHFNGRNPYLRDGLVGCLVFALWVFGTYSA